MPQFVRSVFDDAVAVGGGVLVGKFQVAAPHRVAEIAAVVSVDQPSIKLAFEALASGGAAFGEAADRGDGEGDAVPWRAAAPEVATTPAMASAAAMSSASAGLHRAFAFAL